MESLVRMMLWDLIFRFYVCVDLHPRCNTFFSVPLFFTRVFHKHRDNAKIRICRHCMHKIESVDFTPPAATTVFSYQPGMRPTQRGCRRRLAPSSSRSSFGTCCAVRAVIRCESPSRRTTLTCNHRSSRKKQELMLLQLLQFL